MKKIEFSPKVKKGLIVTGSAVISVGIITAISLTMTGGTPANTNDTVSSEISSEPIISIAPIEENSNTQTQSTAPTFNPENKENQTTELTTISKPTSQPPAPKIEGDSKIIDGKETPPTNSALTDKNHKPTYKTPPTVPSKPKSDKSPSNQPLNTKPSKPANNNTGNNDPVFGNFAGNPGGQGTTVGNPGDELTGNKVGIMD